MEELIRHLNELSELRLIGNYAIGGATALI